MIALRNPSIRSTVRKLTLIAAMTSLLLAMITPFVGTAEATLPGSSFDATDAKVDVNPAITKLPDVCPRLNPGTDDGPINGNTTKLNVIHDDAPPTIDPDINHPGHSDLCNIWIGSEVANGQFLVYLAWEREAAGGSSGAYWEFQQSQLACVTAAADCNPFANRQAGDFIVHFDFQGNSLDDITIREFDGTNFGPGQNPSDILPDPAGEASTSDDRLFGEAVLNLTELGILDPNAEVCESFAGVIPGSATGNSDTSDYKDIVLTDVQPNLTNCGSLKVTKSVVGGNDYGTDFPISLDDGDLGYPQNLGHGESFTQTDLFAGDYTVSEDLTGLTGWSIDSIVCSDGASSGAGVTSLGGVTVVAGELTTCTVTNSPDLPDLTIVKQVVNDDGGSAAATDFTVRSNGNAQTLVDEAPDSGFDSQASVTLTDVAPGDYTITEDAFSGYTNLSITCDDTDGGSTATLALGGSATCTVVNDDDPASLTLEKVVENTNGGSATEDDFAPTVEYDGSGDASGVTTSPDWDTYDVPAGTYTVGEEDATGSSYLADGDYIMTSIVCDGEETDSITLGNGDSGTCTITNTDVPAGLTVVKIVHNDHGGGLSATDFPLTVNGESITTGIAETFPAGDYTIAETQQDGYELVDTYCTRDGADVPGISGESFDISVGLNEEVVCTFENRDIPARVTLVKTVINDDGGDLENTDFPVDIDGDSVSWDTEYEVDAGEHTVGEVQQDGYTTNGWGGDCSSDEDPTQGSFTAELDTDYTCTITNDDQPATVTLLKTVINDDGGTLEEGDFPAFVDGESVTWGVSSAIDAGEHTASETQQPGYAAGDWGGDCAADGSFTAELGGSYECTITNDDIAPTITLVKTVVNNDGGTLTQDDFPSFLDGNPLAWDTTVDTTAGAHTASETTQPGYTAGDWGGDCAADGSFTAELDTDYECTITNDDQPGTLILTKEFEVNWGGTATEDDFTPTIDGGDAVWGENTVDAGSYTVDETDADGSSYLADGEYVQVSIVCDGESTDQVTVANGETKECVVTNADVPAGLTVVKQVNNNWGGTLEAPDFPLSINGDEVDSGAFANYPAGDYTIAEVQQPGYEFVSVECVSSRDGTLDTTSGESVDISVGLNENVVCTFTNRDVPPTLTVLKEVVNDDGGTATEDAFTPVVNEAESIWGSQDESIGDQSGVQAGSYTIGEIGADGYEMTGISCSDETVLGEGADTVTVELGLADDVTCTIVNDDIAPTVVLRKTVVNDDGGTLTQDDFPVTFDGESAAWDETITTTAGSHTAAETTQPGYLAGEWGGDCAADGTLTTTVGGAYECTITNDDVPAGLTVVKQVVNDDGGTATVADFPLTVTPEGGTATTVTSGVETIVGAGTYTISEEQQPGYELVSISCDNGTTTTEDSIDVTVGLDEAVICTVVNDDVPISIDLIKVPDVEEVDFTVGGDEVVVTYTYTVTNTGDLPLTDLSLVDDILGDITLPVDELAVGQTILATAEHVVTQEDAEAGTIVNVAVVDGTSPDGRTTDDTDDAEVAVNLIEVAPQVVVRPAPTLPATGIETLDLAMWSALVAGLGALFLLASGEIENRRRRRD